MNMKLQSPSLNIEHHPEIMVDVRDKIDVFGNIEWTGLICV